MNIVGVKIGDIVVAPASHTVYGIYTGSYYYFYDPI